MPVPGTQRRDSRAQPRDGWEGWAAERVAVEDAAPAAVTAGTRTSEWRGRRGSARTSGRRRTEKSRSQRREPRRVGRRNTSRWRAPRRAAVRTRDANWRGRRGPYLRTATDAESSRSQRRESREWLGGGTRSGWRAPRRADVRTRRGSGRKSNRSGYEQRREVRSTAGGGQKSTEREERDGGRRCPFAGGRVGRRMAVALCWV